MLLLSNLLLAIGFFLSASLVAHSCSPAFIYCVKNLYRFVCLCRKNNVFILAQVHIYMCFPPTHVGVSIFSLCVCVREIWEKRWSTGTKSPLLFSSIMHLLMSALPCGENKGINVEASSDVVTEREYECKVVSL